MVTILFGKFVKYISINVVLKRIFVFSRQQKPNKFDHLKVVHDLLYGFGILAICIRPVPFCRFFIYHSALGIRGTFSFER